MGCYVCTAKNETLPASKRKSFSDYKCRQRLPGELNKYVKGPLLNPVNFTLEKNIVKWD